MRKITKQERAGILLKSLDCEESRLFEIAYATMQTTGQGFKMVFQASGPHADEHLLEAIAVGYEEQSRFTQTSLGVS